MIDLAACLCFKNSASYLGEWLAFYHALGVQKFYLYDNGSTDSYRPIVQPYLYRGLATLTLWKGAAQQEIIYQHCLCARKHEAKWIAFMDDDEFLWPVVDVDLPAALRQFDAHAGVAAAWFLFGSSHHQTRPLGSVIESYTWRATHPDKHVKCVVRTDRVRGPLYIGHLFVCEPGFQVVDEHHLPVIECPHTTATGDILRINHYATKSMEEVRERRTRPRADNGKISEHPLSMWEYWAENWNQTEDRGILRFADRMHAVLKEFAPKR